METREVHLSLLLKMQDQVRYLKEAFMQFGYTCETTAMRVNGLFEILSEIDELKEDDT